MHKGVCLLKAAGALIPDLALEKALKEYPTTFGGVVLYDGKLDVNLTDSTVPIDDIKEFQESFQANICAIYLGNFPQGFHGDDNQPFVLLSNEAKEPLIIAFVEGDFVGFGQEKSTHSSAFFLTNQLLIERINQYNRLAGGDIGKILSEIKSPLFKRELDLSSNKSHDITIVAANGEIINFAKNNTVAGSFPWGRTSDVCGYIEEPTVQADAPKKGGLMGMFGRSAKPEASAPAQVKSGLATLGDKNKAAAAASSPVPIIPQTSTAPSKPFEENGKYILQVPKGMKREDKKAFIKLHAPGKMPNNWMDLDCIVVDTKNRNRTLRSFKDLGQLQSLPVKDSTGETVSPGTAEPAKVEPAPAPAAPDVTEPDLDIPIIPREEKEAFTEFQKSDFFKKALGSSSAVLDQNPADIQAGEKKHPTFSQQMGISLEDFVRWPPRVRVEFAKNMPIAAAVLMGELTRVVVGLSKIARTTAPQKEEAAPAATAAPAVAVNSGKPRMGLGFGRKTG